uniref:MerR family transcriptional regulator n=1 Tax=Acetatifactor sp. TaxID=1872090 RepID=UPI004055DC6F
MKDKMTSGEIARKTGLSQKAIRLYDEKGLLKPAEYSEGNYRLYDKESLLVLEKIIALKQVGFSLEKIRENLNQGNDIDVCDSLKQQIKLLEEKKHQLELSIECIRWALERCADKTDWESIAEIMRTIQINQSANERYLYYQSRKDEAQDEDWYAIIMRSLALHSDEKVLDLGCGYGLLWRNNWHELPKNMVVNAVDIPGSHGADFAAYIEENKTKLPIGTEIRFDWLDVEEEKSWAVFAKNGPYDHVIAQVIRLADYYQIDLEEAFIKAREDEVSYLKSRGV